MKNYSCKSKQSIVRINNTNNNSLLQQPQRNQGHNNNNNSSNKQTISRIGNINSSYSNKASFELASTT
jgi:hypothetical protein